MTMRFHTKKMHVNACICMVQPALMIISDTTCTAFEPHAHNQTFNLQITIMIIMFVARVAKAGQPETNLKSHNHLQLLKALCWNALN